ncbi:MAG: restriction endonuclease [Thiomonas sp.]
MARRRNAKSINEIGWMLLAAGGGSLLLLGALRNSVLAPVLGALRPLAWLTLSLGAFVLGIGALRSGRRSTNAQRVEPGFGRSTTRDRQTPGDGLIDDDLRNRWRPVQSTDPARTRPTAWTQDVFDLIEWRRFEALCEALLQHEGYITASQPFGVDGGVDIRLYSDASKTQLSGIVQCKNWSRNKVGEVQIREFLGLKTDHRVATAIYITSSTFMPAAQALASRHGLTLVDGPALLRRIQAQPPEVQQTLLAVATEGDYRRPTCVQCGAKMIQRTNTKTGTPFWACSRCRHTLKTRRNEVAA